jgi:hypothetical protein
MMEYYRIRLDELHTSVDGDIGLVWGVHTEEFQIRGRTPEAIRVRFTNALRWDGQTWRNLLMHRDAQVFDASGRYIPRPSEAPRAGGVLRHQARGTTRASCPLARHRDAGACYRPRRSDTPLPQFRTACRGAGAGPARPDDARREVLAALHVPGSLDDPSHDYSQGSFGLQIGVDSASARLLIPRPSPGPTPSGSTPSSATSWSRPGSASRSSRSMSHSTA